MGFASSASAVIINSPVPTNAYISQSGLDWAWAFPCPAAGGFCGDGSAIDLTYQSTQGWRLPTALELAIAPLATDFLFAGANVPFNGSDGVSGATFAFTNGNYTGDGACATPYFTNSYLHCDWGQGNGQPFGPWSGSPGASGSAEQLVVRQVPEPSTVALIGLALLSVFSFGMMRRRADF